MLWEKIKDALRDKLPETTHVLWIEPLRCIQENTEQIELACPDRFFCAWVRNNYLSAIRGVLDDFGCGSVSVVLSVAKEIPQLSGPQSTGRDEGGQLRFSSMPEGRSIIRCLHPRYTFDEFMVGASNQLAQSACQAISQGDSSLGSHLYINAGTGLGKSHLTHAVAHNIVSTTPGTRLFYVTAQQFSAEMVRLIRSNSMDTFKEKYHYCCDVLLLEDVHWLSGKAKTQIELNEVLDHLMKSGKRVILTGAKAPRELVNIDEGFRSRLSAGLITTINPPDQMTRKRIIRRKAANCNLPLSDDLVEYLVQNIRGDIRQVESAIVGLKAKTSLLRTEPDLAMVKEIVAEIVGSAPLLSAISIRDITARFFKVSVSDLQSNSRKKSIAFPRQVSMYLARKYTDEALAEIGRAFNRDHSTVLHSVKVITDAMARNTSVRGQVDFLAEKLKQ